MNRSTLIPIAFFLAVVAAGFLFMAGMDEDPAEEAADAASLSARVAALEQEVEQLRAEVRRLRGAAAPEVRPRPGAMALRGATEPRLLEVLPPRGAEIAEQDGQETLRRIVESDDPEVREQFQALVRDEVDAARSERWERRMQRRAERRQAQLEQLSADVGLSADQQSSLQALLEDEAEQIGDLFRAAREDGSFETARSRVRDLREATDDEVAGLLDDDQYEAWQAMREEGRGGR